MNWLSNSKVDRLLKIAADPDFDSTKYLVIRQLDRGGMGTVYLAEDTTLARHVAIKVLNTTEADSDVGRRMAREARIIARLEHPGIVPVHDVGVLADGRVFYAMKFVRGVRLDEYVADNSSLRDRLRKFQAACEAVAFAHAHGVIHRDLKPRNIMIGSFGEVLILDWGVAKILGESSSDPLEVDTLPLPKKQNSISLTSDDVTEQGTVIGTPGYMSPEQARGEVSSLDARTDVYSLGAILYFLLTNHSPSKAATGAVKVTGVNPRIAKAARAICSKAMATSPEDRYPSAEQLSADVASLLDDEPISAYHERPWEKLGRWAGKNRLLVFLVLAYLLMRVFFIFAARR